jgi:hypothetical protein
MKEQRKRKGERDTRTGNEETNMEMIGKKQDLSSIVIRGLQNFHECHKLFSLNNIRKCQNLIISFLKS